MATVAEILVKTLVQAGVKRVYGIVGDSLNGIIDAIRREKSIEWIHVRHEEDSLCRRRRCARDGRACGLYGELRAGQSSSDQWIVRLSP